MCIILLPNHHRLIQTCAETPGSSRVANLWTQNEHVASSDSLIITHVLGIKSNMTSYLHNNSLDSSMPTLNATEAHDTDSVLRLAFVLGLLLPLLLCIAVGAAEYHAYRRKQDAASTETQHAKMKQQALIAQLQQHVQPGLTKLGDSEGTDANECAICLDEFAAESLICTLQPCQHRYHLECIQSWLIQQPQCPMCRSAFVEEQV